MHNDDEWGNIGNSEKFEWSNDRLTKASTQARKNNKKRNRDRVSKMTKSERLALYQDNNIRAAYAGWSNLTSEERDQRIKNASAAWNDEEHRKQRIENIRKGRTEGKHATRGKKLPDEWRKSVSESLKGKPIYRYPTYVLVTDKGIFKGPQDAAEAYNVKPDTVSKWITKHKSDTFYWIPNPDKS